MTHKGMSITNVLKKGGGGSAMLDEKRGEGGVYQAAKKN